MVGSIKALRKERVIKVFIYFAETRYTFNFREAAQKEQPKVSGKQSPFRKLTAYLRWSTKQFNNNFYVCFPSRSCPQNPCCKEIPLRYHYIFLLIVLMLF